MDPHVAGFTCQGRGVGGVVNSEGAYDCLLRRSIRLLGRAHFLLKQPAGPPKQGRGGGGAGGAAAAGRGRGANPVVA